MSTVNDIEQLMRSAGKLVEGLATPQTNMSLARQAICYQCPMLRRGIVDRCAPPFEGGCGCVIAAKTRIPEEHCPQGRW
jgi:hypothetical protein